MESIPSPGAANYTATQQNYDFQNALYSETHIVYNGGK